MDNPVDEHLIRKSNKPIVRFNILLSLLAVFIMSFVFEADTFNISVYLGLGSIAAIASWAFVMHQRCERHLLVSIFVILGIIIHLHFLYDVVLDEITSIIKYHNSIFLFDKFIVYFYLVSLTSFLLFKKIKLKAGKSIFKLKKKE